MSKRQFIVGEVSKSWIEGEDYSRVKAKECLCGLFEMMIETNRQRGYQLHSFSSHCFMNQNGASETIIAVFKHSES